MSDLFKKKKVHAAILRFLLSLFSNKIEGEKVSRSNEPDKIKIIVINIINILYISIITYSF
jgi:hypothetical protein